MALKELELGEMSEKRRFSLKRIRSMTKSRERSNSKANIESDGLVSQPVEEVKCSTVVVFMS